MCIKWIKASWLAALTLCSFDLIGQITLLSVFFVSFKEASFQSGICPLTTISDKLKLQKIKDQRQSRLWGFHKSSEQKRTEQNFETPREHSESEKNLEHSEKTPRHLFTHYNPTPDTHPSNSTPILLIIESLTKTLFPLTNKITDQSFCPRNEQTTETRKSWVGWSNKGR